MAGTVQTAGEVAKPSDQTSAGRRTGLLTAALLVVSVVGLRLAAELGGGTGPSAFGYFDRQAFAWLDGELSIRSFVTADLTEYDFRFYVPFPPLASVLMLPWAAVSDGPPLDTTMFSILVGGVNAAVTFRLLEAATAAGLSRLGRAANLWLTALAIFGTVHLMMAVQGSVWFVAQIVAYPFVAGALWAAIAGRSPWFTGSLLAVAMWARPHVALIAVALVAIHWMWKQRQQPDSEGLSAPSLLRLAVPIGLPLVASFVGLLLYNLARFDDLFDFGYLTQNVAPRLAPDLEQHGQFNLRYLPRNAWYLFGAPPETDSDWWPGVEPNPEGMSVFLTTPALLWFAFAGRWARRGDGVPSIASAADEQRFVRHAGWAAVALVLVPVLTYYNTGWFQFGYRFLLDAMPLLILLLAMAAPRSRVSWTLRLLIAVSVGINLLGVSWFHWATT